MIKLIKRIQQFFSADLMADGQVAPTFTGVEYEDQPEEGWNFEQGVFYAPSGRPVLATTPLTRLLPAVYQIDGHPVEVKLDGSILIPAEINMTFKGGTITPYGQKLFQQLLAAHRREEAKQNREAQAQAMPPRNRQERRDLKNGRGRYGRKA